MGLVGRRETPFSAIYVRQIINGQEVVLLDYLANIFRVGGEDQLAKYNKNLGFA
ncbi:MULTISPECIES: phage major tail tube protein [unclassified Pseudomonas]|uniref:phage major tail tube protein n=1 Tax=unclassified Pseudomonas TaxID=196821 RepID=UPI000F6D0689|nr:MULTISPECIES: phage major tail tube protein [unclassified Pseudomonas]AZF48731.1 Phage tail connector protein [Pseudomonas sp. R2-7-07]AZF59227.1 Phage tail connector protein [Pseudomonas sp. R11-23-07]